MSKFKLIKEIVDLSQAREWQIARSEWSLIEVYIAPEGTECLCGHSPIKEVCILKNKLNLKEVNVGNFCVKKFIGISSDRYFQSVKRVGKNKEKSFNMEIIDQAFAKGWINPWEVKFYKDIARKRKLSLNQLEKKTYINRKIYARLERSLNA